ncbi:MAG TPA: hypothetical protein VK498_07705 [Ferruginibacter sp.]|nr:hypothetical protein [Ferruginibacter sp.]
MKKIFFSLTLSLLLFCASGQKLSRITLSGSGNLEKIAFELGEYVIINISKDGNLINWGVDNYIGRGENYMDKLSEYTGKTGYYSELDNEAFRGKLKFIGMTYFTYYASYDDEMLRGKIKTIGKTTLDYYSSYENESYKGLFKSIGPMAVTWYGSFDNASYKGKIKSLGLIPFTYYSSLEDKLIRGKVKSIDRSSFTYYTSFDKPEYRGGFKTGSPVVYANGIKFQISY